MPKKNNKLPITKAAFQTPEKGIDWFCGKKIVVFVSIKSEDYCSTRNLDAILDGLVQGEAKIQMMIAGSYQSLNSEYQVDHTDDTDEMMWTVLGRGRDEGFQWQERYYNPLRAYERYKEVDLVHSRQIETDDFYSKYYDEASALFSRLRKEDKEFERCLKESANQFAIRQWTKVAQSFHSQYKNQSKFAAAISELELLILKSQPQRPRSNDEGGLQEYNKLLEAFKNVNTPELRASAIKNFFKTHSEFHLNTDVLEANFTKAVEVECRYFWVYLHEDMANGIVYAGSMLPIFEKIKGLYEENHSDKKPAEWIKVKIEPLKTSTGVFDLGKEYTIDEIRSHLAIAVKPYSGCGFGFDARMEAAEELPVVNEMVPRSASSEGIDLIEEADSSFSDESDNEQQGRLSSADIQYHRKQDSRDGLLVTASINNHGKYQATYSEFRCFAAELAREGLVAIASTVTSSIKKINEKTLSDFQQQELQDDFDLLENRLEVVEARIDNALNGQGIFRNSYQRRKSEIIDDLIRKYNLKLIEYSPTVSPTMSK